jgi:molecular chaperone DnaK
MRQKIDYGIDLGTTNSAVSRMEGGEAVILKSDDNQMDTTPSCISFMKNKSMFVGQNARNTSDRETVAAFKQRSKARQNSFLEFKRTMGTDHEYPSSFMARPYLSEELSAEVLKKLRGYVRDESVDSVVITVPAMFRQNQLDATQRAAELAGFKYCELLQEPIAASIAYGIKANQADGYWVVFDFGGGTFDAALMHVDEGIMKVVDTEGDNHLGGKNLDTKLVDELFIPAVRAQADLDDELADPEKVALLQGALKRYAEEAKIALSSRPSWTGFIEDLGEDTGGEEIQLDIKISLPEYERVCGPIFQKAVDICLDLLKRNGLKGSDLVSVILVGGPTFSQTLRRMLMEQVTPRIDTSIDPMTAVARGAALFASTRTVPTDLQRRDTTKAQLTLKYPETTVEARDNLGIRIDRNKSSASLPQDLYVEVIRSDKAWSSGRVFLDGDSDIVEVSLNEGKANQFSIKLSGRDGTQFPCEPNAITVIHGLKIANATLPRGVGLEIYSTTSGKQGVFPLEGLRKNTTLPAKGTGKYKTAKMIRPGNKADRLTLSFYEFDFGGEGSRAILNQPIGSFTLTGEDLPALLPEASDVEVTVSFDASRRVTFSVYIPSLDETLERKGDRDVQKTESSHSLLADIEDARLLVNKLEETGDPVVLTKSSEKLAEMERLLEARKDDVNTTLDVRESLKKVFINLEKQEAASQWPTVEQHLDGALTYLHTNQQRYGDGQSKALMAEYDRRVTIVKAAKDYRAAEGLAEEMLTFAHALTFGDIGMWVSFLKEYDDEFDTHVWTDRRAARRVLDEAKVMIATNPSLQRAQQAVRSLWALQPPSALAGDKRINDELLRG